MTHTNRKPSTNNPDRIARIHRDEVRYKSEEHDAWQDFHDLDFTKERDAWRESNDLDFTGDNT